MRLEGAEILGPAALEAAGRTVIRNDRDAIRHLHFADLLDRPIGHLAPSRTIAKDQSGGSPTDRAKEDPAIHPRRRIAI
jgi:hypothetical protein